jgi:CRP/FNR family cyclic AMP-dependent transcriptional regulator
MAPRRQRAFDPKSFLAKVGEGRSIDRFGKDQIVFSQGDPADAVFYIQKGKAKVTVVSEQGKEAVVAIFGTNEFFGEGCLAGQGQRISTVTTSVNFLLTGSVSLPVKPQIRQPPPDGVTSDTCDEPHRGNSVPRR